MEWGVSSVYALYHSFGPESGLRYNWSVKRIFCASLSFPPSPFTFKNPFAQCFFLLKIILTVWRPVKFKILENYLHNDNAHSRDVCMFFLPRLFSFGITAITKIRTKKNGVVWYFIFSYWMMKRKKHRHVKHYYI